MSEKTTSTIEREYIIPLRDKIRSVAIYKKTPKAVKTVKEFVAKVKEQALGEKVIRGVNPGEQFTKIMHDELSALMGDDHEELKTLYSLKAAEAIEAEKRLEDESNDA